MERFFFVREDDRSEVNDFVNTDRYLRSLVCIYIFVRARWSFVGLGGGECLEPGKN